MFVQSGLAKKGFLSLNLLSISPHFVCSRPLFRYLSALTGTIAAGNKLMLIYAVSEHTAQHTVPLRRLFHTAFTIIGFRIKIGYHHLPIKDISLFMNSILCMCTVEKMTVNLKPLSACILRRHTILLATL